MIKKIILLFMMIWLLVCGLSSASAQESEYTGLDILFLVDQSDSMGRIFGGGLPNDPFGLRFYSPWYAMYWMGEDRLLVHNNADFRMAIVNFGSSGESWVFDPDANTPHWVTINPESRDTWKPVYDYLTSEIDQDMRRDFSQRELGGTNFQAAFETAKATFSELPETSGKRLRVIVVLTDGEPSAKQGEPPISVGDHMSSIEQYSKIYFQEPDYRMYVIGMINSTPYWPAVEPYWEAITNDPCPTGGQCTNPKGDRAGLVSSNEEVGKRFQDILQELTNEFVKPEGVIVVDKEILPGPLVVPPYLKSISFTNFKSDLPDHLILEDVNGPIDLTDPQVKREGVGGPIEVIHISNPQPGQWLVGTDPADADVKITMRQIFAKSQLLSPLGPQVQYIPILIQYALMDDEGNPLPSYADKDYELIVDATVSTDGQSWDLELNGDAQNTYEAEFTPVESGTHHIYVRAVSQDLEGKPVVVFDGEIGSFDVSPADLVPVEQDEAWQQYREGSLQYELKDSRGFSVNTLTPLIVEANISGENAPVNLELVNMPDGTFLGKFTPEKAGSHIVHLLGTIKDSNGDIHVVIDKDVQQFDVTPTKLVKLVLTEPKETQGVATDIWPFSRNTMAVAVEFQDEDGNSLNPEEIFASNPEEAIAVSVTNEKGKDYSPSLQPILQGRQYRSQSDQLGVGKYDIRVDVTGELLPGYLFEKQSTTSRHEISWTRNPLHIPLASLIVCLLALGIVSVIVFVRKEQSSREHPCAGEIIVVDMYGARRWQVNLSDFNRKHLVFPTKQTPIPPITHISRLEFKCNSDQESKQGQVQISVWLDNDKTPTLQRAMRQGTEVKLGRYSYWLLKDPGEEQLLIDRSNQVVETASQVDE